MSRFSLILHRGRQAALLLRIMFADPEAGDDTDLVHDLVEEAAEGALAMQRRRQKAKPPEN